LTQLIQKTNLFKSSMFHAFSDLWTDRNNQNPLKTLEKKKKEKLQKCSDLRSRNVCKLVHKIMPYLHI